MKMWIALVASNAIWAGVAIAQVGVGSPRLGYDFPSPLSAHGVLMTGESPSHQARTIRVDEDGYAICSPEKKP